jgi:serine/threonine-protein kinase
MITWPPEPTETTMTQPDAITCQPPRDPSTTEYRLPTPATPPEDRARFALLVPPTGPRTTDDLQLLLRSRLRLIALILFALHAGSTWIYLGDLIRERAWVGIAFNAGMSLTFAAYAVILWKPRPLELRELRTLEVVLFTLLMLGYVGYACSPTRLGALEKYASEFGGWGVSALSAAVALPGFAFLVIYGTYIPNTAGRCAKVLVFMAALPLLATAGYGLATHVPTRLLLEYLAQLAIFLGVGVAVAVYSSHRIEVLRQSVQQARKIGQYQLRVPLGSGSMGEVYLAEHPLLRRPCAIKLIRRERAGDPRNLARFEREVRTMATLTHPNTVEVYDYGRADDGTFYYVMEYLPGLNLDELIKQEGPLPPGRVVHLLLQVCGALQEAHGVGLIHRDLKPSNIMVCERGGVGDVAKLLDFGLVRETGFGHEGERLTQEGALAGTPAYMSPEQAAAKNSLDARSDLYSLGAVAYFLLTGQPPFVRSTAVQVLAAHLSEPAAGVGERRGDVPADLQDVVRRCLEKDPAQRFAGAGELEQALARCGCAGAWTREQAAEWWRQRGKEPLAA